jgi:hypothetical protein
MGHGFAGFIPTTSGRTHLRLWPNRLRIRARSDSTVQSKEHAIIEQNRCDCGSMPARGAAGMRE